MPRIFIFRSVRYNIVTRCCIILVIDFTYVKALVISVTKKYSNRLWR
jgi:hypothetical protein